MPGDVSLYSDTRNPEPAVQCRSGPVAGAARPGGQVAPSYIGVRIMWGRSQIRARQGLPKFQVSCCQRRRTGVWARIAAIVLIYRRGSGGISAAPERIERIFHSVWASGSEMSAHIVVDATIRPSARLALCVVVHAFIGGGACSGCATDSRPERAPARERWGFDS